MIEQDLFAQWQKDLDERLSQIHAEIDRVESYLRCLRQLKDAAMLSSYPGVFKSRPIKEET